jgi:hypothetical protein
VKKVRFRKTNAIHFLSYVKSLHKWEKKMWTRRSTALGIGNQWKVGERKEKRERI